MWRIEPRGPIGQIDKRQLSGTCELRLSRKDEIVNCRSVLDLISAVQQRLADTPKQTFMLPRLPVAVRCVLIIGRYGLQLQIGKT
jgi:hypothetical protein